MNVAALPSEAAIRYRMEENVDTGELVVRGSVNSSPFEFTVNRAYAHTEALVRVAVIAAQWSAVPLGKLVDALVTTAPPAELVVGA